MMQANSGTTVNCWRPLGSAREAGDLGYFAAPAVIGVNHVAGQVETVRRDRVTRQAQLIRLEGQIAARRGYFEEARAMYDQSIGLYDGLGNLDAATTVET